MASMVEGKWKGSDVKAISGSDVYILDKLGGLKVMCLRSAWASVMLWFTEILDDFANREVGKPQPYLFE